MAQLLSTNVSGTLAVTQNTTVSGNLIVSGYNVLNEIFQADNLARVTANSGATQSAVSLNFVNTATVTVSVTSGGTGVANIGFTSLVSGGVTSVGTGIGLTGGPITSTGTISANIASTTGQGVTKLIDSVTTNDAANAATAASVKTAFDQATLAYGQANSAYTTANSAANTVRVTANSGSAQSAVGLNFNNTATIRVNVGAGSTGNANVSFDYIGSVTGGSGINNFPVSANSGSTVTANGLNFVNSSSILVSVAPGTTGNASVTLTATNISDDLRILSGVNNESNVRILSDNRLTEWSHLENGNIFNLVNETTPSGVYAGNNGNSIYVVGQAQDNVTQYNLSTAWNVATASFAANLSVSAQEATSVDLFFKNDGTTLYVLGDTGNDITYYTLGTPWSLGGTITLGGTYSVSAQTSAPRGMHISDDGTKMWVSTTSQVFQYTIATPWNLATASYDNKSYTQVEDTGGQSVSLNPSGTRMLILGSTNDYIYEYALSTANDVSTAAYTGRKKPSSRRQDNVNGEDVATGMYVAYSNNKMYIVGTTLDQIIEYNLDKGLTIETNTLSVEGAGHFTDSLFVGGDIRVGSSVQIDNTLAVTGAADFFGSPVTFSGGTFTWNGQIGTFGTSTANSTYTIATGATLASRTKTVDIGTGGVAGSATNITLGALGVVSNVNINANTTTFSNTVNIGNQLVVSGIDILNEIGLADNLTRVSANSGSVQSAVSLNFNNTSTIRVNVGSGAGSNANISFDYIGSVTGGGGGGINNFPVSANSGSTITANGLNFVNTSYATVSVSAGTTGNANVAITPIGLKTENYASVFSDKGMGEWVHNKDGKFFTISAATNPGLNGIFANTSGTRFYVSDNSNEVIYQLNLTEAWNIASASTESANLSIAATETASEDIFLKNDGTILYVLGDQVDDITWYDLSEAWNVRTAVANTTPFSISGQTTSPRGLFIKEDGTKFWVCSTTTVYQYSMSIPWSMAAGSASYDGVSLVTTVDATLTSLSIDPTGNHLYLVGSTNDRIYEYYMSTPFNVGTASYTGIYYSVKDRQNTYNSEGTPTGIHVAYSNNRMYIVGSTTDSIMQYEMERGITIDAKKVFANGKALFGDDIYVIGDLIASEVLVSEGSIVAGSSGQFVVTSSGATSTSGTLSTSGTFTASGTAADLGTSTANATYSMGSGATLAGRTKNINIGTNGVAGSFTNINIGTNANTANVVISANTVTISNTVNIGNQLVVSGLNIVNEIALADNLARVSANSGSVQSAVSLNFVNTSTVTVSVTPGETGVANIEFTSSGSSGVTSISSGLGLTASPNPITATGTISANIASTTVQGVTKLIDSVTSTDSANAATGAAVKTAFDQATLAYQAANTADDIAVAAYGKANTAHETAVAAYGQANTGLNKTQVSANSVSVKSNVSVNFVNTASIFVSVTDGTTGNANVGFSLNTTALRTIWVPAQSMVSRTTAGAVAGTTESATNRVMAKTFDFDTATQEFVQFSVRMPKSWNLGTVSFAPYWTAAGTTAGTVAWTLAGMALADNQAIDTAFGTSQTSSDTWQTADFVHIGPEPATPITIGNTPAAGDIVFFQVSRDVANDTLDRDAKLLGIALFVTVNARDDT